MYRFEFKRPRTVEEAISLFEASEDASYISGGMTLVPTLKQRLAMPSELIDLSKISALKGISLNGEFVEIGAMVTHAEISVNPLVKEHIPALASLAEVIGDASVRNRGTIGGSLANSDPAADYPAAVLALSAVVKTSKREIEASDFFVEMFETALDEGEIITSISFPFCKTANYQKFSNPASRYAIAGVFVAKHGGGVKVAVTGAGAYVFRHKELEVALNNNFNSDEVAKVSISAEGLNQDVHASAEYRASLIKTLAARAVAQI